MCGGVRFPYQEEIDSLLAVAYTPEQLAEARINRSIVSVFWQPLPVLPVLLDEQLILFDWGNRDKQIALPQTGWIRRESFEAGKWDHLHPQEVQIPATEGLEKKVWFPIHQGIYGYLVQRGDVKRVYMLTEPASASYQALTGHDRMPVLIGQTL